MTDLCTYDELGSSELKGLRMKLSVDPEKCQGHTLCAMTAPQLFELSPIDGHATAIMAMVPAELQALAREAAGTCPEQAIVVED